MRIDPCQVWTEVYNSSHNQCGNCWGLGGFDSPSSRLQPLSFEWKSVLHFNPGETFHTLDIWPPVLFSQFPHYPQSWKPRPHRLHTVTTHTARDHKSLTKPIESRLSSVLKPCVIACSRSELTPRPCKWRKYVRFSTWTQMLDIPASLNSAVTCSN